MPRFRLLCLGVALASSGCAGNRALSPAHPLAVSDAAASVPGCPDWSDTRTNAGEATSANYGCATMTNLAEMIADPQDLLHGRTSPVYDADAAVRTVRAARSGASAGAAPAAPKGGQ